MITVSMNDQIKRSLAAAERAMANATSPRIYNASAQLAKELRERLQQQAA